MQGVSGNLQLMSFGAGLSLYYFPLSRFFVRGEGIFGFYGGAASASTSTGLYMRTGAEAGFRFTPNFILSLNGGYGYYQNSYDHKTLHSGVYIGLTAQINFETRAGSSSIDMRVQQTEPVYPAFLSLYQKNEVARLTIANNENAELRDVRVSFRADNYTASEFICGTIPFIARGRNVELPLYADFAPEILNFTEDGRIAGEVLIRYRFLGQERETVRSAAVQLYNRNTFTSEGGEWTGLAAFVSPSSPEILEFSKYITGMARTVRRPALNQNLQFGIWLFEGMRVFGIDVTGNREQVRNNREIQFPAQTLVYKSGTALDTGLFFAAVLESAGIPAALIPLEDDFVTLIGLGVTEAGAATLFNGTEKILIVNDEVWLPLSMNALNDGFTAAWNAAAGELNAFFGRAGTVEFIVPENAWEIFPPAPFPALGVRIRQPDLNDIRRRADTALNAYITSEINSLIQTVQRQIQSAAGLPLAGLYNRLGILQARSGRTAEAKTAYERAAGMGSVPAMNNRGNLALNENDYAAAERWFRQALQVQPENATALWGLEQAINNR
jgi:hypothetical protein